MINRNKNPTPEHMVRSRPGKLEKVWNSKKLILGLDKLWNFGEKKWGQSLDKVWILLPLMTADLLHPRYLLFLDITISEKRPGKRPKWSGKSMEKVWNLLTRNSYESCEQYVEFKGLY